MCLENSQFLGTAESNIIVYKTGCKGSNRTFYPKYHSDFQYSMDISAPHVSVDLREDGSINHGYHAYRNVFAAFFDGLFDNQAGIFIIPKGTKYWKGDFAAGRNNNYVSETLIYVGRLNPINYLKALFYKTT